MWGSRAASRTETDHRRWAILRSGRRLGSRVISRPTGSRISLRKAAHSVLGSGSRSTSLFPRASSPCGPPGLRAQALEFRPSGGTGRCLTTAYAMNMTTRHPPMESRVNSPCIQSRLLWVTIGLLRLPRGAAALTRTLRRQPEAEQARRSGGRPPPPPIDLCLREAPTHRRCVAQ